MPLITFEGIEGSGKSTQADRLAQAIGGDVLLTFEPGATAVGARIRDVVLGHGGGPLAAEAELMLFLADRAQHVAERIRPALEAGRIVICDRFTDSTLAYQGYGRGIALDRIESLSAALLGTLRPDLTFLLDVRVDTGLSRAGRRGDADRIESERRGFHARVREGYLKMASAEPQRWVTIDGEGDAGGIARRVQAAAAAREWFPNALR